jgi:hypothetical protein
MELHKANLEAAQPMVTNPNLSMNPFMPQIHPYYTGCFPASQNQQLSFGAMMAGQQQQAQLAQQQQQAVSQQLVSPQAPSVSLASNILHQQQQATSQQQLVNSIVSNSISRTNSSMINTIPGNNCYPYANGTNGNANNVMSVNNLAAALPIAYFLSKPSAVAAAVSQPGGQSCSGSCTGTTTTVSSGNQYLNLANGGMSAQQQQQAAAAMLGLQSLAAVQQQVAATLPVSSHNTSSPPSSSLNNSYHVTPKLKSPAGLLTVSSGRGTDKFSPY